MRFEHSGDIWGDFPELTAGALFATGITGTAPSAERAEPFLSVARSRVAATTESQLAEIQAWRRAFARMGLKPTQYRCAAESLLRRLRNEGTLPALHPLVDVCNAVSVAFAIPVAVFDVSAVSGNLQVGYAAGTESYLTFSGETEHPAPGEVIFRDDAGQVHARRWCNRQSGLSAIRDSTRSVLIVAEAMHDSGASDISDLVAAIAGELKEMWSVTPEVAILSPSSPRFFL